ncbi:homeobox-leucine zipper protein ANTHOCYANINLESS 2 isoform X3 [Coffea arabica]|uniref:Homeobox-leucine zipper protein ANTHOCYANINLESS 2 isoform X3 n=1 Tax=Coffea arabica TaxID=13443 RepID=A0A6P6VMX2_COFAR|nr:homeobox-leucine zipper protein ROC6-like isoform X3 [Coffea arabica]
MSFGGFIGGGSSGGGGGDAGLMMADNLYSTIPTSALAHTQPHMVSPPPMKPKMEGAGDMGLIGENFGPGDADKSKEEEYESRSGSDNIEGASGDDQDTQGDKASSSGRKKYHRHTPFQIQELEASFKENPHPDEKARLELGRRLNLESKQVKFWFQNRRTQMKTQMERHENNMLKQENDKLRIENIAMKEAMRNPVCSNCGGAAALGEISIEEHHLRIENARLRDELSRICGLANKFLGRPLSSLASPIAPGNSDLELAVGRNAFAALSSVGTPVPMGLDFTSAVTNPLPILPTIRSSMGMTSFDVSIDKSMYLELAVAAMDELLKLAQIDNPLWFRSLDGFSEALNLEEYNRVFPPCVGTKPSNFITEATKATGTVIINSTSLVEILMDPNRWTELFSCMIGRASTIDVVTDGTGGTRNGALQLMHAEFQVLSPLVPVREVKFLRFCKQHAEGFWAVVDVSVDSIRGGPSAQIFSDCRRLPSGCIVQDMPNGYAKVIWVEHMEYDDSNVHQSYRPLLRSGLGFGAQKWVATLERQCECLAVITSSTVPGGDHGVISPSGRRSIAKLAQRMTHNFCAGVCATVYKWEVVQVGNADEAKLVMRKSMGNPGEPPGVVLSATSTVWMPVSEQRLFDFLRNEQTRSQWDVLSHDGAMQQMFHIAKGQDLGNSISLLRSSATSPNSNQNGMLILQETSTDVSGSLIVYAAVDIPAMNVVMSGGDSSCVVLLPSGFSIVPDCYPDSAGPNSSSGNFGKEATAGGGSNGCLLTVGFQILVNSLPASKLTLESIDTVNALIGRTLQGIRSALECS